MESGNGITSIKREFPDMRNVPDDEDDGEITVILVSDSDDPDVPVSTASDTATTSTTVTTTASKNFLSQLDFSRLPSPTPAIPTATIPQMPRFTMSTVLPFTRHEPKYILYKTCRELVSPTGILYATKEAAAVLQRVVTLFIPDLGRHVAYLRLFESQYRLHFPDRPPTSRKFVDPLPPVPAGVELTEEMRLMRFLSRISHSYNLCGALANGSNALIRKPSKDIKTYNQIVFDYYDASFLLQPVKRFLNDKDDDVGKALLDKIMDSLRGFAQNSTPNMET